MKVIPAFVLGFLLQLHVLAESRQEALQRLHLAISEYTSLMGEPPGSVEGLILLTDLEESDLYIAGGPGLDLFERRPSVATPDLQIDFAAWQKGPDIDGNLPVVATCEDLESNSIFVLRMDGNIEVRPFDPYDRLPMGKGPGPLGAKPVSEADLARPSARLGLRLREVKPLFHDLRGVVVDAILPGYGRGEPDGPEDLRPGDWILALDGMRVASLEQVDAFVAGSSKPILPMTIWRDREERPFNRVSLSAVWEQIPPRNPRLVAKVAKQILASAGNGRLGVFFDETADGVMVRPGEDSAAERAGIQEGDIIRSIDGRAVEIGDDLSRLLIPKPAGAKVEVELVRNNHSMTFDVILGPAPEWEINYQRFEVHYGQIDLPAGLKLALYVEPYQVVDLYESEYGYRSPAVEWLEKAVENRKFSHWKWDLHLLLAECLAIDYKPDRAREVLQYALDRILGPYDLTYADYAHVHGFILLREGRFEKAIKALQQAKLKRDPWLLARRMARGQGTDEYREFENALARHSSGMNRP